MYHVGGLEMRSSGSARDLPMYGSSQSFQIPSCGYAKHNAEWALTSGISAVWSTSQRKGASTSSKSSNGNMAASIFAKSSTIFPSSHHWLFVPLLPILRQVGMLGLDVEHRHHPYQPWPVVCVVRYRTQGKIDGRSTAVGTTEFL